MSGYMPVKNAIVIGAWVTLAATAAQAQSTSGLSLPGAPSSQSSPVPGNDSPASSTAPAPGEPGFMTGLLSSSRSNLLGDIYGVRPLLNEYGISLGLQETSEVLGNVTGGVRRGAAYEGLTSMSMGVDLGKAIGLEGGIFNVSAFQIHGRNLSAENLYTLQTASGIEALRATRLWELWYQQSFAGGKADIKIGQQSLDQEFYGSAYSGLFINTMMGWPLIPSVNLYAGGPAYPLASLGVRLRVQPMDNMTVLGRRIRRQPARRLVLRRQPGPRCLAIRHQVQPEDRRADLRRGAIRYQRPRRRPDGLRQQQARPARDL